MNDFGSFLVVEKNPLSGWLSIRPLIVDSKLTLPVYLVDGFHGRAMSRTVDEPVIDWASFVEGPRLQLWSRKGGTPVTYKNMICVSPVLSKASVA